MDSGVFPEPRPCEARKPSAERRSRDRGEAVDARKQARLIRGNVPLIPSEEVHDLACSRPPLSSKAIQHTRLQTASNAVLHSSPRVRATHHLG